MDRLNQLRSGVEASRGGDATLDTSSLPSEAYMSANESSSKYFSLSDSTFDITPIKDVSLASAASAAESDHTMTDPNELLSNLSPITKKDVMLDSFKIGKQIEAANILSGGVNIFEDNDNSFDGDELVIDDNVDMDDKSGLDVKTQLEEAVSEGTLVETHVDVASKDTEVMLQIDGKNVDAIDIGNGLYLYRKAGQEELAAVQIITEDDQQAPSFKFLKVRENAEGNLEVYEEFEIEVSKDLPVNEAKPLAKKTPHAPMKDISESTSKVVEKKDQTPPKQVTTSKVEADSENEAESKTELNLNGKMMKFNESRKSPVVGSFTPMTYHSTPNKEGKPLTKTMVDQQLHPSRHSDNVKKTIEVHTDSQTKKITDESSRQKCDSHLSLIQNTPELGSEEKKDLRKDNENITNNAGNTVNKELQNVCQISTDDGSKMKVDDVVSSNTVESTKVFEEACLPKASEGEVKDLDKKEKDVPKPKESTTPDKYIEHLLSKHSIFPSHSDRSSQISKSNAEKEIDQVKAISQEKTQETVSPIDLLSTYKNKETIKQNVTIPEKESPVTINDVSSPSLSQNIQNLQPEVQKDSAFDDTNLEDVNKTLAASIIPTVTKLETYKQEEFDAEKVKDTKQMSLEAENSCHVPKLSQTTELKTKVEEEQINSVTQANDNVTNVFVAKGTELKPTLQTEKNNQVDNNKPEAATNPEKLNPSKGIDLKIVLNNEKLNPDVKSIVPMTDPPPDKLKLVAEPITQKTEMLNPAFKVETAALTAEMNILDKKLEPQTNTLIPVAKFSKPIVLNPIKKKIESVAGSQSFKSIADPKENLPKTEVVPASKIFELKTVPKTVLLNPVPKGIIPRPSKVEKVAPVAPQLPKSNALIITSTQIIAPSRVESANVEIKIPEASSNSDPKPINNNHTAVPFGKWTDANRQEFVNKFKDIKVPATSNTKQIKNSNDLNRIDVLKKIDSQRCHSASAKAQDKSNVKDTVFSSKLAPSKTETKIPVKNEGLKLKAKPVDTKSNPNRESTSNTVSSTVSNAGNSNDTQPTNDTRKPGERKEVSFNDLIGKAIVGMLNRQVPMPMTRSPLDEPMQVDNQEAHGSQTEPNTNQHNINIDQEKLIIDQQMVTVDHQKVTVDHQKQKADQRKQNTDQHKLKADQRNQNTDQHKLNTDQQKLKADQRSQNTDQHKLNTDQQKLKAGQRNQNTDQHKLNTDQQKLKADQRNQNTDQHKLNTDQQKLSIEQKIDEDSSGSLDDIEMKMNELHGIPFVERPPHELPKAHKTYSKGSKKHLTNKPIQVQENVIDLESDEEVIEHEPITGDIDVAKKLVSKLPAPIKTSVPENKTAQNKEPQLKEPVITENDFDKFARRNSITFEDCLTVKFDGKEPANVVQSVKEKNATKIYPRNEMIRMESMAKLPHKQTSSQSHSSKIPSTKFGAVPEDPNNKNYQSKIHTAYQSALTTKRQLDRPITIIEDKPVKVVFMDPNAEFVPNQLNVQGKELSPAKKAVVESTKVSPQAVSSDGTDVGEDKQQDDTKAKSKHQRKQVLTPVKAPDLELIQPRDLGLDVSPKKKRKTDDNKIEKSLKNLVHKKSYLLGRAPAPTDDKPTEQVLISSPVKETVNRAEIVTERTVSAIDNLVKAAELLENQSVHSASPNPDSLQNTPVKRGRGRPRKYPLPEGATSVKNMSLSPSPPKKPRLIDAKPVKRDPISDEGSSDEEQMIRENWTMGKINENIVCPICNKLFRSENVVFKHVKHCTGVSPTRSDLDKRSPRRRRYSKDSDNKSFDSHSDDMEIDEKPKESVKSTPRKRKSKESVGKPDEVDIIVIEDTPVKEQIAVKEPKSYTTEEKQPSSEADQDLAIETKRTQDKIQKGVEEKPVREQTLKEIADEKAKVKKIEEQKAAKGKKEEESVEDNPIKLKKPKTIEQRSSNLVCEFCGKTFRQLSYLANHKLQHKKEQLKKLEAKLTAKQVFSCEVCKKEFRKLHHLVQHRIIHNPEAAARTTRNSSSEQSDTKVKEQPAPKQSDDTSAGFRCEPCDKSFRKLHHLVEHRETHDGINRQKTNSQVAAQPIEKPPPPPQCDVCKKSFRKLHHLIEHKEQHHVEQVETSSEKSDDKSVQSSLSTRDIIHECSLCYMVFPNEHSLTKHFVICQQKKKRQSKAKDKPVNVDGVEIVEESTIAEDSLDDEPKIVAEDIINEDKVESEQETKNVEPEKIEKKRISEKADTEKLPETEKRMDVSEIPVPKEEQVTEIKRAPAKRNRLKSDDTIDLKMVVSEKIKKIDDPVKEMPKKTPAKDKIAPSVTKRQRSIAPLPVLPEGLSIETSLAGDEDEIRYMLNPNFKADETSEGKIFMKVRSNKRNSLQIERPNSRELMNRRTSLQHPPRIPRLKAKAVEPKVVPTVTKVPKSTKPEATSTDSDDSDVKYSFPDIVTKPAAKETPKQKKVTRKSMAEKRKSLSGIAKRKSVGQAIAKLKVNPPPVRIIKRRTLGVEHRCDCGQLFSSAALLTRHTGLAHTPPRIRRRRSPAPAPAPAPADAIPRSVASEASNSKPTRKSSAKSDTPVTRKSIKPEQSQEKSSAKLRRSVAHRGVPVPEKMRKLMMKSAK